MPDDKESREFILVPKKVFRTIHYVSLILAAIAGVVGLSIGIFENLVTDRTKVAIEDTVQVSQQAAFQALPDTVTIKDLQSKGIVVLQEPQNDTPPVISTPQDSANAALRFAIFEERIRSLHNDISQLFGFFYFTAGTLGVGLISLAVAAFTNR